MPLNPIDLWADSFAISPGDDKFVMSEAEQTTTNLRVKHCAVRASQSAGLGSDLRNVGKWR